MTNPLRVLVIDDNPSDRALIVRQLKQAFSQLQVQEIINAKEFERAIANDAFDAVVTDYQLGWNNGLKVLRTVKARSPRCPVIMFTNTGTEEIAVEALKSGLDDYVLKGPNRYIRVPAAISLALERLETQRQAALLEIRLQGLLEQIKVGIFRSTPDGTLIEANPAFLELLRVESLVQANKMNLLDTRECYRRLSDLPPPQRQEREAQLQRGDRTSFWALLTTTLVTVEEVTVIDGMLEDITQRKQTEAELHQLNNFLEERVRERTAQLEEANQALEEFAYSISHDLRAPLRAIQGFAYILLEDLGKSLNSDNLNYLQRISANAEQLDTLIADILTYSRLRQAQFSLGRVDLSLAIAEVLTQLEAMIQQQQAQIQVEEPLPSVQSNYLILLQVSINLLSNAIKFVKPNVQPRVRVWAEMRGSQTRLWIEDNGIGIALEQQQQIFRPFTRLHSEEEYPGTGIGLAIARKGVERMGGRIGVESQPNRGSRFWIELPSAIDE